MSKLRDALKARLGIHNNHGLLSRFGKPGSDFAIEYSRPEARSVRSSGARVWSPSVALDPNAHWTANGSMCFHGLKAVSVPKALEWAGARVADEFVPSPFGGLVPKYVVEAAKQAVRAEKKA
jgi:hypothetical protein